MCGRYELVDGRRVFTRFKVRNDVPVPLLVDNGDVRPTQQVLAVQTDHVLALMRWGLVPVWARDPHIGSKLINARAEGIAQKPSFKRPLRSQRCIIPASAFFEWQGTPGGKVRVRIAHKDGELFGFAGLYDTWTSPAGERLTSCSIITTTPNRLVAPIHNFMPAILLPEDEEEWLNPNLSEPEHLLRMLAPYPAELLEATEATVATVATPA